MFKQLTAASIALSTLIAPAAMANEITEITPEQSIKIGVPAPLANAVANAGIPVVDGQSMGFCNKEGFTTYGVYHGYANAIIMCLNSIDTAAKYVETYTHEAVHLVQDCRAGLDNVKFDSGSPEYIVKLWHQLPKSVQDNIVGSYEKKDWNDEVEAYYFEGRPQVVAAGVEKFCF